MINNNKYKEIKITYVHIITLIVAFVGIGLLLFFLGYRIGKGSIMKDFQSNESNQSEKKVIKIIDESKTKDQITKQNISTKKNFTSEIDRELQMHNTKGITNNNIPKEKIKTTKKRENIKTIKSKKITRSTFYAIQIGAFRDHKGAKKEAQRFSRKYSTEIIKSGNLYKVRIGSYRTEKRAQLEIKKNPKLKGCYTVKIKR